MKNLLIACVGDDSLHQSWLDESTKKNFDLMLVYYGNRSERYRNDCEFYMEQAGTKWHLIKEASSRFSAQVSAYDYIWCPDDDIATNTFTVNRLFALAAEWKLRLAQPSLTHNSFYSHRIYLQHPGTILRYTNMIENMVPIFSREAFLRVKETFTENCSGWGLDIVWPLLLEYEGVAVLDCISVRHTRLPGRGQLYRRLAARGVSPYMEFQELMRKYSVANDIHYEVFDAVESSTKRRLLHRAYHSVASKPFWRNIFKLLLFRKPDGFERGAKALMYLARGVGLEDLAFLILPPIDIPCRRSLPTCPRSL